MKVVAFLALTVLLLSSCASPGHREDQYREASTFNQHDDEAFRAVRLELMSCMGHHAAVVIHGSDDVPFLVEHIAAMCQPIVDKLTKAVQSSGFSPAFTDSYVQTSLSEAKRVVASLILKEKAKESGA